jgi:hypothetical protein
MVCPQHVLVSETSRGVDYFHTGFPQKNGRILNVSNIGLVRYKTVKVATLDSVTHIVFSHTRSSSSLQRCGKSGLG